MMGFTKTKIMVKINTNNKYFIKYPLDKIFYLIYLVGCGGYPHPGLYQPNHLRMAAVSRPETRPERMLTAKSCILSLNAVGLCLRRLVRFRTFDCTLSPPCLSFCIYYISHGIYFQDGILHKDMPWDIAIMHKNNKGTPRGIAPQRCFFFVKNPVISMFFDMHPMCMRINWRTHGVHKGKKIIGVVLLRFRTGLVPFC